MPLLHPNLAPGNIRNIYNFRKKLLALTVGVVPKNLKIGTSFGVGPLRNTQGAYYDYVFQQCSIKGTFETSFVSDTPLGIHINATPWGDISNQTADVLYNYLEKYDGGAFVQKDRLGRIRCRNKEQTPYADEYIPSGFSYLEMQLTLSRYATLVQDYYRRNNRMVARQYKWYREQHPDIIAFATMSSEYQQNNHSTYGYSDYCDSTKHEFRDWLSGKGLYAGKEQYSSLSAFNNTFSGASNFPYASWDVVEPPVYVDWSKVTANGKWWNKWDKFRISQIRNIEQDQVNWTIDGGLTPDQVYGHQTCINPATTKSIEKMHGGYWTTTFVDEAGNGITASTENAWDTNIFSALKANDKNWGIVEYNPQLPSVSSNLSALEIVWENDAHIICPYCWIQPAPYGIAGTAYEIALQQFISNHFDDFYSGLKTYEADPSSKDVIWTMSYESDIENFKDISSIKFTNGVMIADISGDAPCVSFDLDESEHFIKSDNYYAASFRIYAENSEGRTGRLLWHENGGSDHVIKFSLKNGWNVYKIDLIESPSWREKDIDKIKLYFNAAKGTEIKLDWFRLEANHCWHFDDPGEIYAQNQLSDITFTGSILSAETVGGNGYFYLSTDKQSKDEHADRAFINSKLYKKIRVKMTSSSRGTGQIHWWQRDGTHDSKEFAVQAGTRTYEIDMTDEEKWNNSITIFRIDPINRIGADFSIEYVSVSPKMIPPRISNSDLIVNSPTPVFYWEEPIEPEFPGTTYSMDLATDFDFTNIVYSAENLTGGENIYSQKPVLNGLHWWRIRAKASDGTLSPWAVPMPIYTKIWTFDSTNDIKFSKGFTVPEIIDGKFMRLIATSDNPELDFRNGNDSGVNAEVYKKLHLRMRLNPPAEKPQMCQLHIRANMNKPSAVTNFYFPRDNKWHDIELDLSSVPEWRNYIKHIKLSPSVGGTGSTVDVDTVYFIPANK